MTQVTPEEIAKFRAELTDYPDAQAALREIEECEGDLEDAAMVLAIRVGQQPEIANSDWLDSTSKYSWFLGCWSIRGRRLSAGKEYFLNLFAKWFSRQFCN